MEKQRKHASYFVLMFAPIGAIILAVVLGALFTYRVVADHVRQIEIHQAQTNYRILDLSMRGPVMHLRTVASQLVAPGSHLMEALAPDAQGLDKQAADTQAAGAPQADSDARLRRELMWVTASSGCRGFILTDPFGGVRLSHGVEIDSNEEFARTLALTTQKGQLCGVTNFLKGNLSVFASVALYGDDGQTLGTVFLIDRSYEEKETLEELSRLANVDVYVYQGRACIASSATDGSDLASLDTAVYNAAALRGEVWTGRTTMFGNITYAGAIPMPDVVGRMKSTLFFRNDSQSVNALVGGVQSGLYVGVALLALFLTTGSIVLWLGLMRPTKRIMRELQHPINGDLRHQIKIKFGAQELFELADQCNRMTARIREVLVPVTNTIHRLDAAAAQLHAASDNLSQGASKQAASLEEISSSMEEMAANMAQTTDNAVQTNHMAEQMNTMAKALTVSATESYTAIQSISQNIDGIDDLVSQTNILALNASVEAARAGAAGRGFAVVAKEVGRLADQTHDTARDIKQTAEASIVSAQDAYAHVEKLTPVIGRIAGLVDGIAKAGIEQRAGVGQVNAAIGDLNAVTQENAAGAEEIAGSTAGLKQMVDDLERIVAVFKV